MNKYYCKCGEEIGNLVVDWEGAFTNNAHLFCQTHADEYMQAEYFEGFITNTPVRITTSTKKSAVKQIIAQFLKSSHPGYLPKTAVIDALTKVKRINEK